MIKAAAIRNNKGEVIIGKSHADCCEKATKEFLYDLFNKNQGFITTEGKFVSRKQAYKIALASGQLKTEYKNKILISEEIWCDGLCDYDEKIGYYF